MDDKVPIADFNFGLFIIKATLIIIIMIGITAVFGYYYEKYLYWKYSRMTEEDWKNWEPKTWNQFKKHFLDED